MTKPLDLVTVAPPSRLRVHRRANGVAAVNELLLVMSALSAGAGFDASHHHL